VNDTVRLVALNVGVATAGATLLVLAGFPVRRGWLLTIAGLAPAVGLASCGLAAAVGAMVGIDVGVPAVALMVVAGLAGAGFVLARRPLGRGSLEPARRRPVLDRVVEAALLALLAYLSLGVVRLAAATGLEAWDGWALWAPKAHALFVGGDVWGPVFRDPEYFMQHQEYPVLLPALDALSSEAIGRFDITLVDVEAALVVVSFAWAAWALLRLVVAPAVAAAVAVALLGGTPLIGNVVVNYADSVVAAFTALGILALLVWLTRGASIALVPAAVFLAAAASTKGEGLLFAVAAIIAAAVSARGFGRSVRSVVAFAAAVLVVPALWAVVDRLNGPGAENIRADALIDPVYLVEAADRITTSATRLTSEIVDAWPLASLIVVAAIAAVCVARLWWPALFVALWTGLSFGGLVGIYYLSTNPIDWLLTTSADRVVFSVVLGAATSAPLLVGLAWERAAATLRAGSSALSTGEAVGRGGARETSPLEH
jgi:Dolichyl-phosphate-mannose-protein mannosyltransferase